MLLGDLSQGRKFTEAGVGKSNIDLPLCLDGFEGTIKVGQFGDISLDAANVAADRLQGFVELFLTTTDDEDVSAFF
jgi:hypothetical protein